MRVIAGAHRGATLAVPEGRDTRPTADRAREGLFNLLTHGRHRGRLDGARVADLFAGCGAVGIEALSRSAAEAVFIEQAPAALRALKHNLARLGLETRSEVIAGDANRPPRPDRPADVLFLDPPYEAAGAATALAAALAAGWLAPDGLAIVQQHPKAAFEPPQGLAVVDDRRYGAARFVLLAREEAAA